MKTTQELLTVLPSSWNDITLAMFQKLSTIKITEDVQDYEFNGINNTIEVLSMLTGESVESLEELSIKDLATLSGKLEFMLTPPQSNATTSQIKWKRVDEITYNDYVVYVQHQKDLMNHLHTIIKNFSKTEMTIEEIQKLSIVEVMTGFFLLKKMLQKLTKRSIRLAIIKLVWLKLKNKIQTLLGKTTK